ncbi:MAG: hypothetical protein ABJK39_14875 [Hyphomicrobiales bacterium]
MADYRSILDRAIDGLANNTEEARRAIYEKARAALMRQLSSLQPALSPAEISKQRLQLEEAVRETEGKFSGVGVLEDAVADALTDFGIDEGASIVEAEPAPAIAEPVTPPVETIVEAAAEAVVATPTVSAEVPTPEPVMAEAVIPEIVEPDQVVVDTPTVEPAISVATPELPKVDAVEPKLETPKVETPSVEVNTPEISVEPAPVDMPAVDVQPTIPPVPEPNFDAPKPDIDGTAPTLSADAVSVETADVAMPSVDMPDTTPLNELRETMVADGVELPPISDDFAAPQDNLATFEAPDPNSFEPDETIAAAETKKSGGKGLLWILILLILIGAGTFGWAQREVVGPLFTNFTGQVSTFISSLGSSDDSAPTPAPSAPAQPTTTDDDSTKSEDRIPTAGGTDDNIQPGTRITLPDSTPSTDPVVIQPATPAPEATQDQSSAGDPVTITPTETAQPESVFTPPAASEETPAATQQTTTPASNLFSSSAILYEERSGSNQPDVSAGNVLWEVVPTGSEAIGSTGLPSVKGSARIESRDITVRFELMRNLDSNLPASHLIEFEFTPGPLFNGDEINNIAGVIAKPEEQKNGAQLKGAIVKVSERVFWVAMSAQAADLAANTDALMQQNWFDIPLVFKSGKRAILTLEKGAAGKKAIEQAFNSWNASN